MCGTATGRSAARTLLDHEVAGIPAQTTTELVNQAADELGLAGLLLPNVR
jgi:hypothetical protein